MGITDILILIIAYLLGSIPFSVVIGKVFYGVDVRKQGSGNPGATNTLRILGTKAGLIVLLLDIGKGVGAVFLGKLITPIAGCSQTDMQAITGTLSIIGHIYSPFLGFKGGKGVATSTGVVMALQPMIGSIMILVFILILITTRYVSLGSVSSSFLYPILNLAFWSSSSKVLLGFSVFLAFLVIIKHKDNIKRLLTGKENKFMAKT